MSGLGTERPGEGAAWSKVRELLFQALELPEGHREDFLDRACRDEPALRGEVSTLLDRQERLGEFLASPVFSLRRTDDPDQGRRLGAYELVRKIGDGGMGAVYLARRVDGELSQQVAVKLLKRGLDTDEILHRFRGERQILADLDHPNIARLLDVGTTDGGRPFLVMEHVEGKPLDVYCAETGLSVRERVRLFRQVCAAVEFAHQRLVVHRDLKPANILVTRRGAPKLLDFGIAKLLSPEAPSLTVAPGRNVGPMTVPYASPEQVRGRPVTTATDIYALGILLYELLTGVRPYRFDGLWPQEIARRMERPPSRPSSAVGREPARKLGEGGREGQAVEGRRQPGVIRRLRRNLRGDLDNIVLKALRPEPERRFSTVEQLSEDLRRYLEDLPVRSRPDTFFYRTRKLFQRHTLGSVLTLLTAGLILAFALVMARQRQTIARQGEEIARERDQARAVADFFLETLVKSSDPATTDGKALTVREAMDRGVERVRKGRGEDPAVEALLLDTAAGVYRNLSLFDKARELFGEALAIRRVTFGSEHMEVAETLHNLASLEKRKRNFERAEQLMREAIGIQRRSFPGGHRDLARGLANLALLAAERAYEAEGEERAALLSKSEAICREALEMKERLYGPDHLELTETLNKLALILKAQGRNGEAEQVAGRCLDLHRRFDEPLSPNLAGALVVLGDLLRERGELENARGLYEEALAIRKRIYPEGHPDRKRVAERLAGL